MRQKRRIIKKADDDLVDESQDDVVLVLEMVGNVVEQVEAV